MEYLIIIGLGIVFLLVGCESSYDDCKQDCLDICMQGKEYRPISDLGMNEPLSLWYRAIPECREMCYNECRGVTIN